MSYVSYESQCCEPRFPSFTPALSSSCQSCCCQRHSSLTKVSSVQIPVLIPSPLSWPPGRCASAPSACGLIQLCFVFFQSQERKSCNFAKGFRCSIDNYKATVDCGEEDDVLNAVGPLPQTMQPKTRTKMPIKMKTVTKHKGHQLANSLVLGFQFVHCLPIDNGSISC